MRSLATRDRVRISAALPDVIAACKVAGFDLVIVETSASARAMPPSSPFADVPVRDDARVRRRQQLEKIDMLDFADVRRHQQVRPQGREDACATYANRYQRNREAVHQPEDDHAGVRHHGRRFNDDGVTALYQAWCRGSPKPCSPGKPPAW